MTDPGDKTFTKSQMFALTGRDEYAPEGTRRPSGGTMPTAPEISDSIALGDELYNDLGDVLGLARFDFREIAATVLASDWLGRRDGHITED
jgi:hypothetical protein